MAEHDFALVIGIAHYPRLRSLDGPVGDAERVAQWLLKHGGVPEENLELVVSGGQAEERPVLNEIDEAFDRLFSKAAPAARRLYVYFAGHGCSKAADHIAFLMANANPQQLNRAMNATEYRKSLAHQLFPEQIFFFDCCRRYDRRISGRGPEWTYDPSAAPVPELVQVALCACGFTQNANERHLMYLERRGLFTQALLEGLQGGAATFHQGIGQWVVGTKELLGFVRNRLRELTRSERLRQDLSEDTLGDPRNLLLATGVAPLRWPVTVAVPRDTTRLVLRDHRLDIRVTQPVTKGTAIAMLDLEPGVYKITAEPGGVSELFSLSAEPLHLDLRGVRDAATAS